jgi:hypothetical protein
MDIGRHRCHRGFMDETAASLEVLSRSPQRGFGQRSLRSPGEILVRRKREPLQEASWHRLAGGGTGRCIDRNDAHGGRSYNSFSVAKCAPNRIWFRDEADFVVIKPA